jgi:hypothetical protein
VFFGMTYKEYNNGIDETAKNGILKNDSIVLSL